MRFFFVSPRVRVWFSPPSQSQLNPDAAVPAAMTERRAAVLAQLKALKERCLPLLQVCVGLLKSRSRALCCCRNSGVQIFFLRD